MHFRSRTKPALLCLLATVAFAPSAIAQQGVYGMMTPQGTFRPMVQRQATTPDTATFTGIYTATINISIASDSTHLDPSTLVCTLTIQAIDVSVGSIYFETDNVPAKVSGATASCNPVIPYNWKFGSGDSVQIQIGYTVSGTTGAGVGRTSQATGATIENGVPKTGSTTRLAYGVRI